MTVRLHYADRAPVDRTVDLAANGVNYETLVEFVRLMNVSFRRRRAR